MSSSKRGTMSPATRELYEAALRAREKSYSPYSGHRVGAALRLSTGEIFSGCNVENSSYGATVCAERGAIQTAVAQRKDSGSRRVEITEMVVVTDAEPAWPPCGMCRQVISEFRPAGKELTIHSANLDPAGDGHRSWTLSELLPSAFTPEHLKRG